MNINADANKAISELSINVSDQRKKASAFDKLKQFVDEVPIYVHYGNHIIKLSKRPYSDGYTFWSEKMDLDGALHIRV